MMNRILIIEDEAIIAKDLKIIYEAAGFQVCSILNGSENVVDIINDINPDIIVSDIYLKGDSTGIELLQPIQSTNPKPLIFITAYSTDEVINELSQIKHDGYIIKPFTDDQVVATTKIIARKYTQGDECNLSCREKEIILLIINGLKNHEIAESLHISHHTVETHRKNIYRKLEVSNVSQMINKASLIKL